MQGVFFSTCLSKYHAIDLPTHFFSLRVVKANNRITQMAFTNIFFIVCHILNITVCCDQLFLIGSQVVSWFEIIQINKIQIKFLIIVIVLVRLALDQC